MLRFLSKLFKNSITRTYEIKCYDKTYCLESDIKYVKLFDSHGFLFSLLNGDISYITVDLINFKFISKQLKEYGLVFISNHYVNPFLIDRILIRESGYYSLIFPDVLQLKLKISNNDLKKYFGEKRYWKKQWTKIKKIIGECND